MKWQVKYETVSNLWKDEDFSSEKCVIVVTHKDSDEFADTQFGYARSDNTWYKVICFGPGDWEACWSDRQQRYIIARDEDFIQKLNQAAGLQALAE